jgi:hypothetical protein
MGDTVSVSETMISLSETTLEFDENDLMDMDELVPIPEGVVIGENGCAAFEKTDSAALDFFFQVVPGIKQEELHSLLEQAWDEDANTALRLIFQTGNSRKDDGGKMDQENWRKSLFWLWDNHPSTCIANISAIPKHTYLKDLLELVVYATHGSIIIGKTEAKEHKELIRTKDVKRKRRFERNETRVSLKEEFAVTLNQSLDSLLLTTDLGTEKDSRKEKKQKISVQKVIWVSDKVKNEWKTFIAKRDAANAAQAKVLRKQKQQILDTHTWKVDPADIFACKFNVEHLISDVAILFANGLLEEMETLKENPTALSGLYSKWAPSVNGFHDKQTRIVDVITKVMFKANYDVKMRCVLLDGEDITKVCRLEYSKILSQLRGASYIPEHFVGNSKWSSIDYNRMASRCRLLYGEKVFAKYDTSRYKNFLEEAEKAALAPKVKGEKVNSVKTSALLPNEVTEKAWKAYLKLSGQSQFGESDDEDNAMLTESSLEHSKMVTRECNLQWHGIVEGCKDAVSKGSGIGSWIPMCDVSGSMSGEPMEVAIALSLLLASVNSVDSGWHGKVLTFDSTPELITLFDKPDSKLVDIGQLVHKTRQIGWGGSTDIDLAMDLFLANSIAAGTTPEALSNQCLVVFSDMEFDQSLQSNVPWETAYEAITAKFVDAGYSSAPNLVFWNLRASTSTPIQDKKTSGVILLSGFSAALLKSFLAGNLDEFTPQAQLNAVLNKEDYSSLVVVD